MGAPQTPDQAPAVPSIEIVHKDIALGNQFRIELVKTILTLAPALLAFTAAFRPKLKQPADEWLMWIGWLGLGISTLGALVNMYGWERFYISYRDYRADTETGAFARKRITRWRRGGALMQFVGFGAGVLAIALFAALNLDHLPLEK